jgi:hypothetical protein
MKYLFYSIFFFVIVNLNAAVAVLPFEDLSKDLNGLDLKISTIFANKLVDKGFEVTYPMEIITYFEKISNPATGWVDRITAQNISKIFRAKLLLLGTIIEKNKDTSKLSLAVKILQLPEYKLVWGKISSITKSEQISILNLNKIGWKKLVDKTIMKMISDIPDEVLTKSFVKPEIDISSVTINPKFLKKGRYVVCKGKFKISGRLPDKVFVKVNSEKIPVRLSQMSFFIKIKVPNNDNRYPVSMTCIWGKPFYFSKNFFLGSFYVDNKKPVFYLNHKFGIKIDNKIYFSKFIKIIPVIRKKNSILKWQLEIYNENDNKTLVKIKNFGALPEYFIWKGLTSRGAMLPNGKYRFTVSIWDKAENFSKKYIEIYLVKSIHPPKVYGIIKNKKMYLNLTYSKHIPSISYCRIEVFDKNGNLIASKFSEKKFINRIELPSREKLATIYYNLTVRDILGNKLKIKNKAIKLNKGRMKRKIEKKWINEF